MIIGLIFRYMRMSPESFDCLLSKVGPLIRKQVTKFRQPISPSERLALTIRYLASGDSQQSMSFSYRISKTCVSNIIQETCQAIWDALSYEYLQTPTSADDWKNISKEFMELWNFPHCLGAIDGKHIAIKCPASSGSLFFNYKGFYSIVLMAVCDAHYVFTLVNIGDFGSNNDSGILLNSSMGKALENNTLGFPPPETFEGLQDPLPYYLVGDEIFGLKTYMQRPFPGRNISENQRIFNYRLSRARRVIENAFGILTARWGIFSRPTSASVKTAEAITKAAVCLHNFLRLTNSAVYCPTGFADSEDGTGRIKPGEWRGAVRRTGSDAMTNIPPLRGRRNSSAAVQVRNALMSYFISDAGSLPWQWEYVRSRGQLSY